MSLVDRNIALPCGRLCLQIPGTRVDGDCLFHLFGRAIEGGWDILIEQRLQGERGCCLHLMGNGSSLYRAEDSVGLYEKWGPKLDFLGLLSLEYIWNKAINILGRNSSQAASRSGRAASNHLEWTKKPNSGNIVHSYSIISFTGDQVNILWTHCASVGWNRTASRSIKVDATRKTDVNVKYMGFRLRSLFIVGDLNNTRVGHMTREMNWKSILSFHRE